MREVVEGMRDDTKGVLCLSQMDGLFEELYAMAINRVS